MLTRHVRERTTRVLRYEYSEHFGRIYERHRTLVTVRQGNRTSVAGIVTVVTGPDGFRIVKAVAIDETCAMFAERAQAIAWLRGRPRYIVTDAAGSMYWHGTQRHPWTPDPAEARWWYSSHEAERKVYNIGQDFPDDPPAQVSTLRAIGADN